MAESGDHMDLFDHELIAMRKARAIAQGYEDFLFREAEGRLLDRLIPVNRAFHQALDLGAEAPALQNFAPKAEITRASPWAAHKALRGADKTVKNEILPFEEESFDLAVSNLTLHWANDLVGLLIQVNRVLRPDGFFLASLFGGETLGELRTAFMEAELEIAGGAGPRVVPMTDIRDAGNLLSRAGFAMPVAEQERITVTYETPLRLMRDLRAMGETNPLAKRHKRPLARAILTRMMEIYAEKFPAPDGRITATFDIIVISGWAPAPGQPRPKPRGSAKVSLAQALKPETGPKDSP